MIVKGIGYAAAWIEAPVVVIAGMYFIGSSRCLLSFLIPAMISGALNDDRTDKEEDEDEMVDYLYSKLLLQT